MKKPPQKPSIWGGLLPVPSGRSQTHLWPTPNAKCTRFSGAGFKGCCMALIDPEKADEIKKTVEDEYLKEFPTLKGKYKAYICSTATGVGKAEGGRF